MLLVLWFLFFLGGDWSFSMGVELFLVDDILEFLLDADDFLHFRDHVYLRLLLKEPLPLLLLPPLALALGQDWIFGEDFPLVLHLHVALGS